MQELTMSLHFVGMALLAGALIGGIVLNSQYKKAQDLRAKALILKGGRTFGFFGPAGTIVMIVTGIGNMHAFQAAFLPFGTLSAKIVVFAVTAILGSTLGAIGRKRGMLVHAMSLNDAPEGAQARLASYDRILGTGYMVMTILFLAVLWLSAVVRMGG